MAISPVFSFLFACTRKRKGKLVLFLNQPKRKKPPNTRQQRIQYVSTCACLEDGCVEYWLLEMKKKSAQKWRVLCPHETLQDVAPSSCFNSTEPITLRTLDQVSSLLQIHQY